MPDIKHTAFSGRLVIVGFGSIGQGVLPLLLRHIDLRPDQIVIITAELRGHEVAEEYGVRFVETALTRDNYRAVLDSWLGAGDFLLNVSVDVSSVALIELCRDKGALYLDTCIEPWPGGYTDPNLPPSARSNYALRESALALRSDGATPAAIPARPRSSRTAPIPGLVSHFVKQALLDVARDADADAAATEAPTDRAGWARLAERLGVKAIHIAERDTQVSAIPKEPGEFVNTWSIDGFFSEGSQPAELGWGTHERHFPIDGMRHDFGGQAAIYLLRPGAGTRVRSWTPLEGPYLGFLITHGESISIADYLSVHDGNTVRYRPTCHYAYHPCDDAVLSLHELAGKNWRLQTSKRLMMDEISRWHRRTRRPADGAAEGRLLVRLAPVDRGGATGRAAQQRDLAASDGRGPRRRRLGDRAPAARRRRTGRDGFCPHSRDLPAVSRRCRRRIRRLDPAAGSRAAVPGGSRPRRPLAVQEYPRRVRPAVAR